MPTLDRQNLESTFDMAPVVPEVVEDEFEQEWEDETNPMKVLKNNIDRANEILDTVKEELTGGNFSARLVEVAGQLINSITAATKEIFDKEYKDKYLDIRQQVVNLKERQIEILSANGRRPATQNLIIASREDVLKLLKDEKKQLDQSRSENESNS